jgi:Holliday junction resolvase RusA-like endonuclease
VSAVAFTVFGQPAPAGSKTIGRGRAGNTFIRDSSKKSYPWKKDVAQAAGIAMQGDGLLEGPLSLELVFHVPRPKGHFGVRGLRPSAPAYPTVKPDVLKLARAVEDAMSGVVFRDDAQIVTEFLRKTYGEPARCEVRVTPIQTGMARATEGGEFSQLRAVP